MKIVVMGCGAMGSIYAGLLAAAGNDVLAIDRNARHVEAIQQKGLHITGASGERWVRLRASTTVPENTSADLIVLAVKSGAVEEAARQILPLMGNHTYVLTLQNGLGVEDDVARHIASDRIISGIAQGFGASRPEPGHGHHSGMQAVRFGAWQGADRQAVTEIARIWKDAGFPAEACEDIQAMKWNKLICNVAFSATCALSGATLGEAMANPQLWALGCMAATEASQIAIALGIPLEGNDPVAQVHAFGSKMPNAKPSTLLDLEAGRKTEIDYINGAVCRKAKARGLSAPVNETLTMLVQFRESQITP
ncbi:Putative ketopantoate reductase [gamma proteobacterium HdN1]|nr:Putative ketopantoate reductase [gamma proteobacterium HdN1]